MRATGVPMGRSAARTSRKPWPHSVLKSWNTQEPGITSSRPEAVKPAIRRRDQSRAQVMGGQRRKGLGQQGDRARHHGRGK